MDDDVATARTENENLRRVRNRLLRWESKADALANLNVEHDECMEVISGLWRDESSATTPTTAAIASEESSSKFETGKDIASRSRSLEELLALPTGNGLSTTNDFLLWYDRVQAEIEERNDITFHQYLQQLEMRSAESRQILEQITQTMQRLGNLSDEYAFVSEKTSALNTASEQLIEEQEKLQQLGDEIQRRLHYFSHVELLHQRLQSPTMSVASDSFKDCLNRIDDCLDYLRQNPKFKDTPTFTVKYRHCLSKAITLIKNYTANVMNQATEATKHVPTTTTSSSANVVCLTSPDAAFALYYGKYQTAAVKIKKISQLVETRLDRCPEYEQLLSEMQQNYLTERSVIMTPAVDKAIKDLRTTNKGDHCSLMRSACAFLVHVCQDEQRLYFQFFGVDSELLTAYLENLCTILYDTMRPFIIHINHLETLAEICSILRLEMLEEHVQQNPEALQAFGNTANQLLQDVQERLVFRAHLYLQSDIQNYNPSAGDLAYPDKLEMMESIAMQLQESQSMRRFDSRASLNSMASSVMETESVDTAYRARTMNSPADLHGMWYPTVRRTLVCLSRLYRCVDRPIFQGLSQEALKLCIQSVSLAASKIAANKTPIDGELFEIKHLLILREQIAPFRVDFTVKETSLDFSKVKTAAYGLLQKRKQLFSMGSNNALLEFLLDGTPQIKEHLLDSRKEVDKQLKTACEKFIRDSVQMLAGPVVSFLEKAQALLATTTTTTAAAVTEGGQQQKDVSVDGGGATLAPGKVNYVLRQSAWASPQQISGLIQETQRLIKSKLAGLQRSMQLYLSNRDTEFIIFRPIRNNIIQMFVRVEQLLTTNGYTSDDMIITSCPTAEQISILLSSASILATEGLVNFYGSARRTSTSSDGGISAISASTRKPPLEKRVSFEGPSNTATQNPIMENVPEVPESMSNSTAASPTLPTELDTINASTGDSTEQVANTQVALKNDV